MANPSTGKIACIKDTELPVTFRVKTSSLAIPYDDVHSFMKSDLSVERIDKIERHLWLAGRPYLPRPLNIQNVLGRAIVATTDASLHLVCTSQKIFVKSLPAYIISDTFHEQHLRPPNPDGPALGLLYTYLALMPAELDFAIAREAKLTPDNFDWPKWRKIVRRTFDDYPNNAIYAHFPARYKYGELRLSRLDKVYRYTGQDLLHGYSALTGSNSYGDFITRNLVAIGTLTAWIAVVLTAMQLGLTKGYLSDNSTFIEICSGFTVFALISPVIAVGSIMGVFVIMFFVNWAMALIRKSQRRKELAKPEVHF